MRSRGLGRVFDSSQGFALPSKDTVEPDTAFVSSERWAAGPPAPRPPPLSREPGRRALTSRKDAHAVVGQDFGAGVAGAVGVAPAVAGSSAEAFATAAAFALRLAAP